MAISGKRLCAWGIRRVLLCQTDAMEDLKLLQAYAENGDQTAFGQLVSRNIHLVYSAALRQTGGDTHQARDITQRVFSTLAAKAGKLKDHPALQGWLHKATFMEAGKVRRSEQRRAQREDRVSRENSGEGVQGREADWSELSPVIDETLAKLSETDRQCILHRILEERSFGELGASLGVSENSARMRFNRAVERLRQELARRGIRSTAGALALALATNTVQAAPAGLAAELSARAISELIREGVSSGMAQTLVAKKLSLGMAAALSVGLGFGLFLLKGQEKTLEGHLSEEQEIRQKLQTELAAVETQTLRNQTRLNATRQSLDAKITPASATHSTCS